VNSTKLRIQAGLETFSGPVRKVRMTPLDITQDVPPQVADLLLLVCQVADMNDIQPGDGELDLRIGELNQLTKHVNAPALVRQVAAYAETMGVSGNSNLFFRVRRTE